MEDIKLVEGVLTGDIQCFNELMIKYEPIVQRFVYNIVKEKHTAEDISQEVFITIYNKLEMYNQKCKFSSWILQIAKNKSIDYIRKYRKVIETDITEARGVAADGISPEDAYEFKEVKREVEEYINELSEEDRLIVTLRYTKGQTFEDISEIMDMKLSTVKRRYYKVRDGYKQKKEKKRGVSYEMQ